MTPLDFLVAGTALGAGVLGLVPRDDRLWARFARYCAWVWTICYTAFLYLEVYLWTKGWRG